MTTGEPSISRSIKEKLKTLYKRKKLDLLKTFKNYDKIIKIKNNYK